MILGLDYAGFFLIYNQSLALSLSLSVTEKSIMPVIHEGLLFHFPRRSLRGR